MKTIKFEADGYRKIYDQVIGAIEAVLASPSGEYLQRDLEAWARGTR